LKSLGIVGCDGKVFDGKREQRLNSLPVRNVIDFTDVSFERISRNDGNTGAKLKAKSGERCAEDGAKVGTMEIVIIKGERHVVNQCGTCAVWHTIPEIVYNSCRREGGFWHCPNGHSRGWVKGADEIELENMRRERDRLKQQMAQKSDEAEEMRRRAVAAAIEASDAKTKVRRLTKRAAAGTCPCCQRTFSNMAQHMKRQHPAFVEETGAKVVPIKRITPAGRAALEES
jgi:hypothetical protein